MSDPSKQPRHPQEPGVAALSRRRLLGGAVAVGASLAVGSRLVAGAGSGTGSGAGGLDQWLGLSTPAGAAPSDALLAQITRFADDARQYVPGCAVAAVDHIAGTAGTYATGTRDLEADEPFLSSTIAIIDSVSKQFTTTMLAQAVVGGLGRNGPLTLDAPITDYLNPYLDAYGRSLPPLPAAITVGNLADYTSGFLEEPSNYTDPASAYSLDLLTAWLSDVTTIDGTATSGPYLHAAPGTAYYYSDVAVDLLGFILADQLILASSPGMPNYDDLITTFLVGPGVLDMPDTFVTPPAAKESRIAKGYLYRHGVTPPAADAFEPAPKINRPPEFFGGGGGLRSTADDMVRFLHALVAPPALQHLQRAIPLAAEPRFSLSGGRSTGLGWDPIVTESGVTILLKDGAGTAGCTSLLGYSPETGRALFFFTNVDGATDYLTISEEFKRLLAERSPAPLDPASTTTTTATDDPSAPGAVATPVSANPRFAG